LVIPTVLVTSGIIFGLMRIVPGDAAEIIARQEGEVNITKEVLDRVRAELGLDKPLPIQYAQFWRDVFNGSFGVSLFTKRTVMSQIGERLPTSIELIFIAILISAVWGISVGVIASLKQDTWIDYIFRSFAIGGLSVPIFWSGILIIVIPSILIGWTPLEKYYPLTENPLANLKLMIFPAVILGVNLGAPVMRMTRTMMLEVLRQDYVRTAKAKGLAERVVILRHSLRNALIPVITILGLQVILGIGGTLVLETVFNIPGMGRLLVVTSLSRRDYPMVQGITLFIAMGVVLVNLIIDLTYGMIDPRVRYK